jgi:hypothetical protein
MDDNVFIRVLRSSSAKETCWNSVDLNQVLPVKTRKFSSLDERTHPFYAVITPRLFSRPRPRPRTCSSQRLQHCLCDSYSSSTPVTPAQRWTFEDEDDYVVAPKALRTENLGRSRTIAPQSTAGILPHSQPGHSGYALCRVCCRPRRPPTKSLSYR